VKGVKKHGMRIGNWLTAEQGKRLLAVFNDGDLRGKRDYAMVAVLLGCGLRRAELAALAVEHLQQREEHWVIADLVGKGGHVRTVPVPTWVKAAVDNWLIAAGISAGPTFRAIYKASRIATSGFSSKVIWGVVQAECSKCGLDGVAPHDLRRYAESRIMPNRQLCGHASKGLDTARYGIVLIGLNRYAVSDRTTFQPIISYE
jgi:integrase